MTRTTTRALFTAATAALLALAPLTPAAAQDGGSSATGSGNAIKSATVMLYNKGLEAAKKGDWDEAYEAFNAAWRIQQHYQIAANLGRAALKTGRYAEAAEHLTFATREGTNITSQDRAELQKLLREAQKHLGTLIIKVNRPGAEVVVDGQVVGQAPLTREVYLDPGSHRVQARLGSERAEEVTVDLAAGQSRQVGLTFGGGKSTVAKDPGPAPQGQGSVGAGAGDDADDAEGSGRVRPIVIGVGVGLAAVAAVTGGVFTTVAFVKQKERNDLGCNQYCDSGPRLAKWKSLDEERKMFRDAAVGTFAASAILGVGTIMYAYLTSSSQDRAPVQVGLTVAPGSGGIALGGTW